MVQQGTQTGSVSGSGGARGAGDGERKGLGWLPWALLAAGVIALAIFLLLRNAGDDGDDAGIDTTDEQSGGSNEDADAGEGGSDTASEATDGGDGTSGDDPAASDGGSGSGTEGDEDGASGSASSGSGSGSGGASGSGQSGSGSSGAAAGAAGAAASPLVANGQPLLPLPAGGLASVTGQPAEATSAPVQSVVSDEGFWVGTSETDRVFVRLLTDGAESPVQVEAGRPISFRGTVTPNPADVTTLGITPEEGQQLLEQQGQHIEVPVAELRQG